MTPEGLKEHNLEADIERYLITEGGYTKGNQATYDKEKAIDLDTLIRFIKDSQPKAWEKFERVYGSNAKAELYKTMQGDILQFGLIHTLRKGIKDHGIEIKLCYFAPSSNLNPELTEAYKKNILECTRQSTTHASNGCTTATLRSPSSTSITAYLLTSAATSMRLSWLRS